MHRLLFFCLLLLPVDASSAQPVYANLLGSVSINGAPVVRSAVLFAGDRLATGPNGAVIIQDREASAQIGPSTDCVIRERIISLESGAVAVRGGFGVTAAGVAVQGSSTMARFEVSKVDGIIVVRALSGAVAVQRGSAVETLTEGQKRSFPVEGTRPAVKAHHLRWAITATVTSVAAVGAGTIAAQHKDERGPCISSGDVTCAFTGTR